MSRIYIYLNLTTPLWKLLVSGTADYHLYFVPLIFKFYLIFPLLWLSVKKFPRPTLFAALLWQLYWYYQIPSLDISDQEQYRNLASWIFYFILGIFLASQNQVLEKKKAVFFIFLTIGGFIWTVLEANSLRNLGIDPIVYTRFTQIPIIFYSTGLILTGLSFASYLPTRLPAYLSTFVLSVGNHSYIIYLCHPLVLRILIEKTNLITSLPTIVAVVIVFTLSYLLALATSRIIRVRLI